MNKRLVYLATRINLKQWEWMQSSHALSDVWNALGGWTNSSLFTLAMFVSNREYSASVPLFTIIRLYHWDRPAKISCIPPVCFEGLLIVKHCSHKCERTEQNADFQICFCRGKSLQQLGCENQSLNLFRSLKTQLDWSALFLKCPWLSSPLVCQQDLYGRWLRNCFYEHILLP